MPWFNGCLAGFLHGASYNTALISTRALRLWSTVYLLHQATLSSTYVVTGLPVIASVWVVNY